MTFYNHLLETPTTTTIQSPTMPFNRLQVGQRFMHTECGPIHQVFKADDKAITIKRADGWLVKCEVGCYCWDMGVVRV